MKLLDKAQNKLLSDFCEKLALSIATAVSAKVFFAEEWFTLMTYWAIGAAVILLILSLLLSYGTEEKTTTDPPVKERENVKQRKKRK